MGKHLAPSTKKDKDKKFIDINLLTKRKEDNQTDGQGRMRFNFKRSKKGSGLFSIILSAILLIAIQFLPFEGWVLKAVYGGILLLAALDIILDVLEKLSEANYFAVENAALLAAIVAFCIGLELESVLIALLFRVSMLILNKISSVSAERIKKFSGVRPLSANVETAEGILNVAPEFVNVGDIICIEAGEIIPLDGVIIEGISTLDTSAVSGQSSPWAVAEGYKVFSGCKNLTSPIKVRVAKPAAQSTAESLIKLAKNAAAYPSRQEKFIDGIKRYYLPAVEAAAFVLMLTLSLINGAWIENIRRAVVLLIASYSSAAFVSVSFAYLSSIGLSAEKGIFVKGSDCLESMAKSETMVFDKTGVITEGRYIITDVFPNKVSEHELLTMAATAERFSRHPIAAALRDAAGAIDIDYKALQIEEIPGRGVSAFVGEKQVYVGNAALLEEHGIKCTVPSRSGAAIHVAVDYKYWGHILITDRIRRGAFDALESLRANGVKKMVLLTGDVLSVARPLASKLNFDMLRAELKPSEKVSAVDFLMSNRGDSSCLAFVGDGRSDEQIMSRVDVGLAMGALGSDKALANADVLIMDRDIKKLPIAVAISRLCYKIALENILAWFVVNVLLVILGALGAIPVLLAVILEFVLITATMLNTLRIK